MGRLHDDLRRGLRDGGGRGRSHAGRIRGQHHRPAGNRPGHVGLPGREVPSRRDRLRGRPAAHGRPDRGPPGHRRHDPRPVPLVHRGRVPGHHPGSGPSALGLARRARRRLRGRGLQSDDLLVRRRQPGCPRAVRPSLAERHRGAAGPLLPLHPRDRRGRERRHRRCGARIRVRRGRVAAVPTPIGCSTRGRGLRRRRRGGRHRHGPHQRPGGQRVRPPRHRRPHADQRGVGADRGGIRRGGHPLRHAWGGTVLRPPRGPRGDRAHARSRRRRRRSPQVRGWHGGTGSRGRGPGS